MIRKTLLVISLALVVGTVGLWVRSYWVCSAIIYTHVVRDEAVSFEVINGSFQSTYFPPRSSRPYRASGLRVVDRRHSRTSCDLWFAFQCPKVSRPAIRQRAFSTGMETYYLARIPLWAPALLFAFYPCWIWRGRLRTRYYRRRHNLCVKCGYSLEGNVSGTCPECGTVVPSSETEAA